MGTRKTSSTMLNVGRAVFIGFVTALLPAVSESREVTDVLVEGVVDVLGTPCLNRLTGNKLDQNLPNKDLPRVERELELFPFSRPQIICSGRRLVCVVNKKPVARNS